MAIESPGPLIIFLLVELTVLAAWLVLRLLVLVKTPSPTAPSKWLQRPTIQQSSPLLRLPAELRLEVWRYILPDEITLTTEQPFAPVPDIGLVCRQTLAEVLPIFLREITFNLVVEDGNGAFIPRSSGRLRELLSLTEPASGDESIPKALLTLRGTLRWKDLLRWVKAAHEARRPRRGAGSPKIKTVKYNTDRASLGAAHAILLTLRITSRLHQLPWDEVQALLEDLPAARDPRWA